MPEWRAGLLAARLGEVMAAGVMDAEVGLELVASAIETKAKDGVT